MFHENGTLEIPVAQTVISGEYTCVARNTLGTTNNRVYLEVKGECLNELLRTLHAVPIGLFHNLHGLDLQ